MKLKLNLFVMLAVVAYAIAVGLSSVGAQTGGVSPANPVISVSQAQQFIAAGASTATGLEVGAFHSCARLSDGTLRCWGQNTLGQLGDGTRNDSSNPVGVVGVSGASSVSAGGYHTCAGFPNGTLQCWGRNEYQQLGNPSVMTETSTTPVSVSGITNAISVTTGAFHTCALLADGTIRCWGLNDSGQLGTGTFVNSSSPAVVSGISGAVGVSAGGWHTCARLQDGTLRCWGQNIYGALGNGTIINSATPWVVRGMTNAAVLESGIFHTCARLQDGTVQCWGRNDEGRVGNGTTTNATTPSTVSGIVATGIGPGAEHSCALLGDGTIRCWGWNDYGQLGNGGPVGSTTTPASPVSGISGAVVVSSGAEHSCAQMPDGSLQCWGRNTDGRLGNGTTTDARTPVGVLGFGATWSSSNPGVATITGAGVATGVSAGTTTITATSGGNSWSTTLTVVNAPALTVTRSGSGTGTVTSNPGGINCGNTCTATYALNSSVTLTAAATGGSTFTGWSGGGCSGTGSCTVTMSGATTVTANFTAPTVTLTVNRSGTGSGTVTTNVGGINCGSSCVGSYAGGTAVTVTAAPASLMGGWSDGCTGTGTCTRTMTANTTVTAIFNQQAVTLTVNRSGTGSGTVTTNVGGINCGSSCTASYASGTAVTLTATPAAGSVFAGWSGGGCTGTAPCTLTLNSTTSVGASFNASTVSAPVLKWQYGGCLSGPWCQTGWYSSPAVADLDGNGTFEVIGGSYDVVALNGANGSLRWTGASGNRIWGGIAVADLTGDGTLEVIVGRYSDQLTVYNRTGGVVWTRSPFGSGELRTLAVTDLEADGQLEI